MPEPRATMRKKLSPLEKSRNFYIKPFPETIRTAKVILDGPAHSGPYKGAIDFAMPLGTPVLAPLDGKVIEVIDLSERYGPSEEFVNDLNYITIQHRNGEFSQVAHLGKGSSNVKKGDTVTTRQQIATTGNSGWMTGPHLHFLVFRLENDEHGFKGLVPQFKEE